MGQKWLHVALQLILSLPRYKTIDNSFHNIKLRSNLIWRISNRKDLILIIFLFAWYIEAKLAGKRPKSCHNFRCFNNCWSHTYICRNCYCERRQPLYEVYAHMLLLSAYYTIRFPCVFPYLCCIYEIYWSNQDLF